MSRSKLHIAAVVLAVVNLLLFFLNPNSVVMLRYYFPIWIYVAAIMLLTAAVLYPDHHMLLSAFWFVAAAGPLCILFLVRSLDEMTINCILSVVCFALIGLFVLLWNKYGKVRFLVIAGSAVLPVLAHQISWVCRGEFSTLVFFNACLPWFPAAPLIPAAVTCLMIIDKHRAKTSEKGQANEINAM